jgi:hypothetical protein
MRFVFLTGERSAGKNIASKSAPTTTTTSTSTRVSAAVF